MRLELLGDAYTVARLGVEEEVPAGLLDGQGPGGDQGRGSEGGGFVSVTRTGEELSIVAPMDLFDPERPGVTRKRGTPGRSPQIGRPQRAFRVCGTLAHELTGVLVSLAAPLADADVPIFAVSTWDTDYVLVPESRLDDALAALRIAGHEVE